MNRTILSMLRRNVEKYGLLVYTSKNYAPWYNNGVQHMHERVHESEGQTDVKKEGQVMLIFHFQIESPHEWWYDKCGIQNQ